MARSTRSTNLSFMQRRRSRVHPPTISSLGSPAQTIGRGLIRGA
jgi:hypothetical protein